MGRILAIDYGRKRVGLAVTDPLRIVGNPLETVPAHEIFDYLAHYTSKEKVDIFVVGLPRQMDGSFSESMQYIQPFVKGLQKKFPDIELVYVDERFTSVMAQKVILESGAKKKDRRDKSLVDKVAASIILQTYLNSIR